MSAEERRRHSSVSLLSLRQWRQRISTGMDQILPNLYVGGLRDAMDAEQLVENGIKAIVSAHGFSKDCQFGDGVASMRVAINDSPGENITAHFAKTNSFIHSRRLKQESVLVHCLAGASRSVCLCVAYLMTVTNLDYASALEHVESRRYCARPNFGFKMQLMKFGQQFLGTERRRLFAELTSNGGTSREQEFLALYRNDCIFTNSLFVAKEREFTAPLKRTQSTKATQSVSAVVEVEVLTEEMHFIDDE